MSEPMTREEFDAEVRAWLKSWGDHDYTSWRLTPPDGRWDREHPLNVSELARRYLAAEARAARLEAGVRQIGGWTTADVAPAMRLAEIREECDRLLAPRPAPTTEEG